MSDDLVATGEVVVFDFVHHGVYVTSYVGIPKPITGAIELVATAAPTGELISGGDASTGGNASVDERNPVDLRQRRPRRPAQDVVTE